MTQQQDTALIMRACRGDGGAFEELGRLYGPALHALIVGQGGEQGANETLQAVLDRAREGVATFGDPSGAGPWLVRLVHDFAPKRAPKGGSGAFAAIRDLPPGRRDALLLRLMARVDGWEIARLLGEEPDRIREDLASGAAVVLGRQVTSDERAYLMDPEATSAAAVRSLESSLERLRFVPRKPPRELPWRKIFVGVALLIVAAGVGLYLSRPKTNPSDWLVVWTYGAEGSVRLSPGQWFETGADRRARLAVGDVGHVDLEPGSRIVVRDGAEGWRMDLERGAVAAEIHAKPRRFSIHTPAGTVVDLGCAFFLELPADGDGFVNVTEGQVEMAYADGSKCFLPTGARVELHKSGPPGIPYFPEAPEALRDVDPTGENALVAAMSAEAPADTLTLFHLLPRVDEESRSLIVVRISELVPLPDGVQTEAIVALDPKALAAWERRLREEW
jgi:ferric-dicitrate binding protein FerR (iron transport regulator)